MYICPIDTEHSSFKSGYISSDYGECILNSAGDIDVFNVADGTFEFDDDGVTCNICGAKAIEVG